MNKAIKTFLGNSWIELAARWILGVIFIYASYHKILAPADFAKIVYGYALFPAALINLIAIIIPFMELVAGMALICGLYPRSAAFIVNGMLLAFIVSISINLIRGHEFNCGCFSINSTAHSNYTGMLLIRDIIYFALGLHVLFYSDHRKLCILAD